jgi:uncharacterized membrane protein
VPSVSSAQAHGLIYELGRHWPAYAAYVTSFLSIGIIWINHHAMITRLERADHAILVLNLLLLATIGILPFATDLMATYLRVPAGRSAAAVIYAGAFLLMSITFALLNTHILLRKAHLLGVAPSLAARRRMLVRSTVGLIPYVIAVGVALVSSYVTLAICGAVAVYYALPLASAEAADEAEVSGG